jgi:hypothetical protein
VRLIRSVAVLLFGVAWLVAYVNFIAAFSDALEALPEPAACFVIGAWLTLLYLGGERIIGRRDA